MGRFVDKNLNVTSVNTYSFFSAVTDIRKGSEGMVLVREKHLRAREKGGRGGRFPLLPSPSRAVSHLNFLSFPFRTPSTQAKDNQVIL